MMNTAYHRERIHFRKKRPDYRDVLNSVSGIPIYESRFTFPNPFLPYLSSLFRMTSVQKRHTAIIIEKTTNALLAEDESPSKIRTRPCSDQL